VVYKLLEYIRRTYRSRNEVVKRLGTFSRRGKQVEIYFLKESDRANEGIIDLNPRGSFFRFSFTTRDYQQTLKRLGCAIDDFLARESLWDIDTTGDLKRKSERDIRIFLRFLGRKILFISEPLVAIPSEEDPHVNEHSAYLAKTAGWIRSSYCLVRVMRLEGASSYSLYFNIFRLDRDALIALRDAIKEK